MSPIMLPSTHMEITFSVITNWSSLPSFALADEMGSDNGNWSNNEDIKLLRYLPIIYQQHMLATLPTKPFLVIFSSGSDDFRCVF